jgi:hypothetical protein
VGPSRASSSLWTTATGKELWRINTGAQIIAAPISYLSDGRQMVSIASGNALFTFGLID